ncbi:MAG TPA: UDP-glucose/GDP-mannose dehydrogenase family protein [Roseiarcus sp.]|nr:UDP-glucose/GDP-mannose dehydrogenase family protein [Roseiarcus sp.]
MRIAMVGAGYVGLVSGACLADFGHEVVCIDNDASKIEALRHGHVPIFEPGLQETVANNLRAGRLSFGVDLNAARGASVIFIAVGTPPRGEEGHADLTFVHAAAREIAAAIEGYVVVVMKSTVPVGTGDEVERIIAEAAPRARFSVVSNPEFLREGAAIDDFKQPDRVVIGVEDDEARQVMNDVYRPLDLNQGAIVFTSRRTSELIKYAANAYLAMKVAFINEISDLCEKVGGDVQDLARGIGLDNRIGQKFLNAGPGFGGSCFPKDTLALMKIAEDAKSPLRLVETLVESNESRKHAMARKIVKACGGSVKGKTIAVLGLTFKPNTDDMRSAPSLTIVPALQAAGAKVVAFDPEGAKSAKDLLPGVIFADGPYACLEGADALVIITEWDAFRALDLTRVKKALRQPIVVDLRNIYRRDEMLALGFHYESVGRGHSPKTAAARTPTAA